MPNKMPSDLINPEARPRTPPPRGNPAPKRRMTREEIDEQMKKAGKKPKAYAKGGSIDGCAVKGKTKGRMR